jgi:hypothetical protein
MVRPGVREALFARAGQKPIPVKVGGEIDGWTVAAIEFDRVVLATALGSQIVRPTPGAKIITPPTSPTTARARVAAIPNPMLSPRSSLPVSQVKR